MTWHASCIAQMSWWQGPQRYDIAPLYRELRPGMTLVSLARVLHRHGCHGTSRYRDMAPILHPAIGVPADMGARAPAWLGIVLDFRLLGMGSWLLSSWHGPCMQAPCARARGVWHGKCLAGQECYYKCSSKVGLFPHGY
jgi:hypothetical protein